MLPVWFRTEFPAAVPKVATPEVTRINPLFVIVPFPPFSVPPFTCRPAVAAIVELPLNCAVAEEFVSLKSPFVKVNCPVILIGLVTSNTLVVSVPLLTVMLLKFVVELPPMVPETAVLKLIVFAPASEKVPLFVKFLPMLCVRLLPATNVVPLPIVKSLLTVNAPPAVFVPPPLVERLLYVVAKIVCAPEPLYSTVPALKFKVPRLLTVRAPPILSVPPLLMLRTPARPLLVFPTVTLLPTVSCPKPPLIKVSVAVVLLLF